jgi:hypothetical protein
MHGADVTLRCALEIVTQCESSKSPAPDVEVCGDEVALISMLLFASSLSGDQL